MRRVLFAVGVGFLALGMAHAQTVPNSPKDYNDAMKSIKSSDPVDRAAGLSFMALLGQDAKSSTRDVVGLMFDGNKDVRYWANKALPQVNPGLADPIMALVNGDDYDRRVEAMQKLASLGVNAAPAIPALLKFLQQAEGQDRAAVVNALATVGAKDPTISKTLAEIALKDADPAVRAAALKDLPKLSNVQAALDIFGVLLKNTDPAQRTQAVTGLASLAATNADAMRSLKAALTDPSPTVRAAAKQAVDKIEKQKR
jgi:HEAT repeat protein